MEKPRREDIDRKIEAMVEDRDWAQKELVSALTTDPGISDRTVRSHLKSLDGRTIKRSRKGRGNRVSSMKRWLAGRERREEFARAHSDQLKRLIDLALDEIPDVDPFVTPSDLVSVAFTSAERGPVRFSTKAKFAFEENVLFDDLLHHVGQLELLVQPAAALPAFRKSAAKLSAARESLWRRCSREIPPVFDLPLTPDWREGSVSELCIALFYRHAIAIARDDRREQSRLGAEWDIEVREAGGYFEAWKSGRGLVSQDRTVAGDRDAFKRWILQTLARGFAKTTRGTIANIAREANMWTKRAQTLRKNLVRSLQEAREFVTFPGRCRFVEVGGLGLSDELLESTS